MMLSKVFTVIVRQEQRVWCERLVGLIHAPEEADDRTGIALAGQFFDLTVLWKQVLINIGQVGVRQDGIRLKPLTIHRHPIGAFPIDIDTFYRRIEERIPHLPLGPGT